MILSLSGESRKQAAGAEESPEAGRLDKGFSDAHVNEFNADFADAIADDQAEKLVNSVSLTVKGREGDDRDI